MLEKFGSLLRAVSEGQDPASLPAPGEVIATMEIGKAPPDWDFTKQVYRYTGTWNFAAVAGANSWAFLENASTTGVVLVVHHCMTYAIDTQPARAFHMNATTVGGTTSFGNIGPLDGRLSNEAVYTRKPSGLITLKSQASTSKGTLIHRMITMAQDSTGVRCSWWEPNLVLWPGQVMGFCTFSVNTTFEGNITWSERAYDAAEVQGVAAGVITF